MTWPLAESHSDQLLRVPGHQVVDAEYDELFEVSYTPACQTLERVYGHPEQAKDFAADAMTEIGMSWRYVIRSMEFVRALALVLAVMHAAKTERTTRYTILARERQQGRSRSSAHDVQFEAREWLTAHLGEFSVQQREEFDDAIRPLTPEDLALLLDINVHQVPRAVAQLWRACTPEEEP
jgi:hypothetical protein